MTKENKRTPTTVPNYVYECIACGKQYHPDFNRLHCSNEHEPALLRVKYQTKQLQVQKQLPGIFRYIDWLPIQHPLSFSGRPTTYRSTGLAHYLGLKNLLISFNGYWPEKNGSLMSCSFKELEAAAVLAQLKGETPKTLVLSSAGNTGRAFASLSAKDSLSICIVTPARNLDAYWSDHPFSANVSLIAVTGESAKEGADYADAIQIGNLISNLSGFFPEGGVYNTARRAGMGLTVIDAAFTINQIPQHYFQAVGSGTGGIAAWEASLLLQQDGRFGSNTMKLHLSQNHPFTPIVDAWKNQQPELSFLSAAEAKQQIQEVNASVLTNRNPAYSLRGGVYDALSETQGETYAISNTDAAKAQTLFRHLEGNDISPAAGIATASLCQAVAQGKIAPKDHVLLNITSGGTQRFFRDRQLYRLKPRFSVSIPWTVPYDVQHDAQCEQMDWLAQRMSHQHRSSIVA